MPFRLSLLKVSFKSVSLLISGNLFSQLLRERYCNLYAIVTCLFLIEKNIWTFRMFSFMYFEPVIRFININDWYVFLMNWQLYYYEMTLLISDNIFALMSPSSVIDSTTQLSFDSVPWYKFFHLLLITSLCI